jgi:hypothetical protein
MSYTGIWAAAPTNAHVPATGRGIDTLQLTMNAKNLAFSRIINGADSL